MLPDAGGALFFCRKIASQIKDPGKRPADLLWVGLHEAEMGEAGWWIILGSIDIGRDNNITAESGRKREIVERAAAKCGYQAFNDFSMKFKGMASGYNVVVLGPYRSKSAAGNILESVRRCVPDAYIRQTEYAGE
jgi:hypothetical protein